MVQRKTGWSDADGWNAGEKAVAGTAIRRIPVEGLTEGNQQDWQDDQASAHLTTESAAGRAIVAIPAGLDPTKPVDMLLHFHGYAETVKRPYAGWRERSADQTVRDVALDQIEQQLHAAGATQLIGVLPQGGTKSQFGTLNMDSYLGQVLDRLAADGVVKARPPAGRIIVSAHSGGGHLVKRALDRKALPTGFGQLVLFEAINNDKELASATAWATAKLDADLAVLADPARSATAKQTYLATSPQLRAYYGTTSARGYAKRYGKLRDSIEAWFTQHSAELGPHEATLRSHYQVIASKGLGHEELVRGRKRSDATNPGEGNLTDAVRAFYSLPAPASAASPGTSAVPGSAGVDSLVDSITNIGSAAVNAILTGFQDENEVTDLLFALRHPNLPGGKIPAGSTALKREWIKIRNEVVRPALRPRPAPAPATARPAPAGPTAATPTPAGVTPAGPATTAKPASSLSAGNGPSW